MKIGLCVSPETAAAIPSAAFDFVEASVQSFFVPEQDESAFEPHLRFAAGLPRPVRAANLFLPAILKCVGPEVDTPRILRYAETAFRRARIAGVGIIVFGSGGARMLPDAFHKREAMDQFAGLLRSLGPLAAAQNVTLVIEPLNRGECNFINSLAEGAEAVRAADHPAIRLLADFYHMRIDDEPMSEVPRFASLLAHVHVAEREGRGFPGKTGEDLAPFLLALADSGYSGALSIECKWSDIVSEIDPCLRFLREQIHLAALP